MKKEQKNLEEETTYEGLGEEEVLEEEKNLGTCSEKKRKQKENRQAKVEKARAQLEQVETEGPLVEEPRYHVLELASLLTKRYNVRSDLVLTALREKEKYTVKEAETLVLAMKKRKVK